MTKPYIRLDHDNAAVLLVDHQVELLSLVRDIEPDKLMKIFSRQLRIPARSN